MIDRVSCTVCDRNLSAAPALADLLEQRRGDTPGEDAGPEGYESVSEVSLDPRDLWRFKTPSLRNAVLTAPYMHDGSLTTLHEVVRFYNDGGEPHEGLDPLIRPLDLSDDEIDDIVAFLEALTDDRARDLGRVAPASVPSGLSIDR